MKAKSFCRALAAALLAGAMQLSVATLSAQESIASLTAAAKKNNADAQYKLGLAYQTGDQVPMSFDDAINWFKKAARQNHAQAQLALGFCYANGIGAKADWREAFNWFKKAAEQDLADAQFKTGFCYYKGLGTTLNEAEALKWFSKAADQGSLAAQHQAAEIHYELKNYQEAYKLFRKAALRGMPEAMYRLGGFHLLGQGGAERDMVEAHKWFILALPLGRDEPGKLREKMATLYRMTPEQIAKSFELAKAFKPQP